MSLIGSVSGLNPSVYTKPLSAMQQEGSVGASKSLANQAVSLGKLGNTSQTQQAGFSSIFENMVESVDTKQKESAAITKQVLLGQNDQLHQSVIAMQEASVSFSLMIEVRNKLVDSYQELMRVPV